MGRILALALSVYAWGHPSLDGRRPAALDRSLREFHRSVNATASDLGRALAVLDDARSMRYVLPAIRNLERVL